MLRISHSAVVDAWRGRERALAAYGIQVQVICARRWVEGGVPVTPHPGRDEDVVPVRTWGSHPALFVYDPVPLLRALRGGWDLVDLHEEPFALATAEVRLLRWIARARSPYVLYTAQNLDKRYPIPFRWIERSALRSAAGVSACNVEAARIAERKGYPGRARTIPLGLDLADFGPAPSAALAPDPEPEGEPERDADPRTGSDPGARPAPGAVTVGFLGRLVPEKGVLLLLDAAAQEPRLRVRIAGDGPLAEVLPDEIARRGIGSRVELVGGLDPRDVPGFYRGIDVLAVPSVPTSTWTEQFGRVAIEAMAAGVPVVASDAGALPDVVGDAGLLVPRGNATALAAALVDATGPRRGSLVAAGLTRATECSWDAVARDYLDLYRLALSRAERHPLEPRGETPPGERPDPSGAVEVIVVAYGASDLLRRALTPVAALPVTVVDNSSLPEIAALCAELGVRYRDPGANLGFGAAVNLALADRLVPGADVLLLNPDAEIDVTGIDLLHAALRADPGLASVGPSQRDGQGVPSRVEWPFPSPSRVWREAVGLGRIGSGAPGFVIGSMLLLRAEALDQVGGFDERFFLYAEETDWAYRAHLLGWRHRAVTEVHAVHAGAGTSTDERLREAMFHASQERYLRKHFGAAGWAGARAAQWLGSMARAVILRGERGRAARRRAALYRLGPVRVERRFRGGAAP